MKAAVVPAVNSRWSVQEVARPEPGPNQVLIRIRASGICYTDVHQTRGELPGDFPRILGERVLKTPSCAREVSPRGCTLKTSRRARSSQVMTMTSSPGRRLRRPSSTSGSKTSQASGAPSSACRGADSRSVRGDSTLPMAFTSKLVTFVSRLAGVRFGHGKQPRPGTTLPRTARASFPSVQRHRNSPAREPPARRTGYEAPFPLLAGPCFGVGTARRTSFP